MGGNIGVVLQGHSLGDEKSVGQAFASLKVMREDRFDRWIIDNRTRNWTVELCFFQGLDESGQIPTGYVADTGVTVGGVEVTPGSAQTTFLQPQVLCAATRIRSSIQWRRDDGYKPPPQNMPDKVAPSGEFWVQAGWTFTQSLEKDLNQPPKAILGLVQLAKRSELAK